MSVPDNGKVGGERKNRQLGETFSEQQNIYICLHAYVTLNYDDENRTYVSFDFGDDGQDNNVVCLFS